MQRLATEDKGKPLGTRMHSWEMAIIAARPTICLPSLGTNMAVFGVFGHTNPLPSVELRETGSKMLARARGGGVRIWQSPERGHVETRHQYCRRRAPRTTLPSGRWVAPMDSRSWPGPVPAQIVHGRLEKIEFLPIVRRARVPIGASKEQILIPILIPSGSGL